MVKIWIVTQAGKMDAIPCQSFEGGERYCKSLMWAHYNNDWRVVGHRNGYDYCSLDENGAETVVYRLAQYEVVLS